MKIIENFLNPSKYSLKAPRKLDPLFIVVHNTGNDASARNEIAYMIRNNSSTSFHFAVDDKEIVQGVPLDRMTHNCGYGYGNLHSISIEICYSKSGGERFIQAEQNACKLIAMLLKKYGWTMDQVKTHQQMNGKYCPHRTLDMGWQRFLNMINAEMGENPQVESKPSADKGVDVVYQVHTLNGSWLPNVNKAPEHITKGDEYAGIFGKPIDCIYANTTNGEMYTRVHVKGGSWLPYVANRKDYAGLYGKRIDGVQMIPPQGHDVYYRVHIVGGSWLPWVKNKTDFAGVYGRDIDGIQAYTI